VIVAGAVKLVTTRSGCRTFAVNDPDTLRFAVIETLHLVPLTELHPDQPLKSELALGAASMEIVPLVYVEAHVPERVPFE